MANLRQAQKQMTRRLLLESGLELFKSKGYAATTVDDIATAAGTTRVTFYAYFPSRCELMRALIDEQLDEALRRLGSSEPGSTAQDLADTVADGTPEAITTWLRRTADSWPATRPLIRIGRDAAVVEPELAGLVERWMAEAIGDIEDGLTRAGRFEPHQRRFRGVLAMAELDFVAQNCGRADWGLTHEQMLDELGASWVRLLT
ncbi:TetR/AcrR family transcriptional regulator [Streptomyces sp. NPDC007157]|uniref:TetR/AcrR family transcriptional regulator n=1 Tax=Streptomyces sp. NPDC007157 TaxID=3154681 RepID=UPI0034092CC1